MLLALKAFVWDPSLGDYFLSKDACFDESQFFVFKELPLHLLMKIPFPLWSLTHLFPTPPIASSTPPIASTLPTYPPSSPIVPPSPITTTFLPLVDSFVYFYSYFCRRTIFFYSYEASGSTSMGLLPIEGFGSLRFFYPFTNFYESSYSPPCELCFDVSHSICSRA
ncbi:hypothetical protein GOP47_0001280 [Adiantum capillus-veneris]|uniref:Uncharacterized protein n=1 Tax=Adiantum capillus-veneris TaxID=13818 RepID=A0A9D4V9S2_ADICA|nr:hypothetical protein GOP47_0001280 [Adiantum capillus-veneris]